MLNKNHYTWSGLGLLIASILVFLLTVLILRQTWLTALSICMLILSFILLTISKSIPKLPPEVCSLLLATGIDNIATLVEELGIRAKAIYLPSSLTGDRPQALIPLRDNTALTPITRTLPHRLIVRYGDHPDNIGLLITTFGSATIAMLGSTPGATAAELETALTSLFKNILGVADKASVVLHDNHVKVEIYNPSIENEETWYHHCLGCPLASAVASVVAEAWNRPVTINREENHKKKLSVDLEVIGENI